MPPSEPAGYVRVTAGRCSAVTLAAHEEDARALLADGTIYEAAARDLAAQPLEGRGVAFAIALPVSGARVVVRHNRHGGMLARLTGDRFFPPTRAPYELEMALRLRDAGVRTPEVVMYGVDRTRLVFCRADVATREIWGSRDLSCYLAPEEAAGSRTAAWEATRALVRTLDAAGARHHDLNVKNVLLAQGPTGLEAWLLDVDRVVFEVPYAASVRVGNAQRLLRSARKWRDTRGGVVDEDELIALGTRRDPIQS